MDLQRPFATPTGRVFWITRSRGCLIALAGLVAIGCGGESSPAPAPSPTTSSVTVTIDSPIRMGATAQASGTATLSNGLNQSVTTGWLSDSPNIATVTTGGLVTGVANGPATIYVITGGRQGEQAIRVTPDYQGTWSGRLVVTGCTQSGLPATTVFCSSFPNGSSTPYSLTLTQSGVLLTATLSYDSTFVSSPVSASILADGSSTFVAPIAGSNGIVITPTVVINSTSVGTLTGTVNEVWSFPGSAGQAVLARNITATTRTNTTALSVGTLAGAEGRGKQLVLDGLATRKP